MNRLLFVMPFTSDIEDMKKFYRDAVGLTVLNESPFFVQFESRGEGTSFALLAVRPQQEKETELCFESQDLEADIRKLRERGVEFTDEARTEAFGQVIHLRDPEGNLISLLEPSREEDAANASTHSTKEPEREAGTALAATGSHSSPTALATAVEPPRFSTAIVNALDMAALKTFYRDRLGLRLEIESPGWVSFHVGGAVLALHPRIERPEREGHHGRNVTLGFSVADLMGWADEARERGLHFTSAPAEEDWGTYADAVDPDGNDITFRQPPAELALEEKLAEEFGDDETPHQTAIRKSVKKGAKAVSRVAVRPEYKGDGAPRKPARETAKKPASRSTRGAGPAGSRLKPKRATDPKRARNRPAIGRLKKAELRTSTRKKSAVAGASKSKPVKHASAGTSKRKPSKRAAAARGRKR
jgi:predicted enzyme related to lactoylglutathione lyase